MFLQPLWAPTDSKIEPWHPLSSQDSQVCGDHVWFHTYGIKNLGTYRYRLRDIYHPSLYGKEDAHRSIGKHTWWQCGITRISVDIINLHVLDVTPRLTLGLSWSSRGVCVSVRVCVFICLSVGTFMGKSEYILGCQFSQPCLRSSLFFPAVCNLAWEFPGILLSPPSILPKECWNYRHTLLPPAMYGCIGIWTLHSKYFTCQSICPGQEKIILDSKLFCPLG